MPQFLNLNFLERFPIPSLRNYVLFSAVLFSSVLYYAHLKVTSEHGWAEIQDQVAQSSLTNQTKEWVNDYIPMRMLFFTLTDYLCIWVVVNTACCLVSVWGNFLKWLVFGKLRALEHQHLRDRFWNFIFYKFVFLFGVLNVQYVDEVFLWSVWFILVGFFYILTTLAQDRFKYVSSAVNGSKGPVWRVVILMGFCSVSAVGLFFFSVLISSKIGWNYSGFVAADAIQVLLRSTYCVCRYGAQLYDLGQNSIWERRHSFIYYTELIFELLILITEFIHHIHMLVWSNIFLSMASLVICMQLRSLYQELDRRLKRHRNYQRVVQHMDKHFPMASVEELERNDDSCAICWDPMESARKLPCGHYFHNWCLRGWLEQDTSCPTCRLGLAVASTNEVARDPAAPLNQEPQPRRRRFNHFFHFDGGRYARWLPSFSVEVSHNMGGTARIFRRGPLSNSQYNNMAEQVREMFPHVSLAAILDDLHETGSADITVENILEERLNGAEEDAEIGFEFDDSDETDDTEDGEMTSLVEEESDDGGSLSSASSFVPASDMSSLRHGAESGEGPSTSMGGGFSAGAELSHGASSSSAVEGSGSRFSKISEERESILSERKHQLIERNKKKYLISPRGQVGDSGQGSSSSEISAERRREIVAQAVQRRLNSRNL